MLFLKFLMKIFLFCVVFAAQVCQICSQIFNQGIIPQALPCGIPTLVPFPGYFPVPGQANFAEYPWMVVILGVDNRYVSGGVLIDANTVLTVAHKVTPLYVALKVRIGEYILNSEREPLRAVEIAVSAIRIHELYTPSNLQNDLAILKLANFVNFNLNPHIRNVCLPPQGTLFNGMRCFISGFGASTFVNGVYSSALREVDVPIMDAATCQARLQTTRLGFGFSLNPNTFLCAGGEPGKDACTGDGGSPLVCLSGSQWYLAGLASWGVGCGTNTVPGIYTNIANYITWITNNRY